MVYKQVTFALLCNNGNGEICDGSFCRRDFAEGSYLSVSTSLISKLEKPVAFLAWMGTALKLVSREPAWHYQDNLITVAVF